MRTCARCIDRPASRHGSLLSIEALVKRLLSFLSSSFLQKIICFSFYVILKSIIIKSYCILVHSFKNYVAIEQRKREF